MTTAAARRIPKSQIVVPVVLGIILVPLSQIALAYLTVLGGQVSLWLVGTPVSYFLIGGLGTFATMSGLVPKQARTRGAWVGLMTGISGACSATVILIASIVWDLAPPQSTTDLHRYAVVMPQLFYFEIIVPGPPHIWITILLSFIVLAPILAYFNLLGIGLAPLGGLLGGYLRACFSPRRTTPPEQTGEQEVT